jgi:hypothetical protein
MPGTVGVILSILLAFVFGVASTSLADGSTGKSASSDETLADEVNDPLARLTQIQIKNEYTPSGYGTDAQPNTVQIRTIFTIRPHLWMPFEQLIRPTVQIVTVPQGRRSPTVTALDDMQLFDLFVMPVPDAEQTGFRWGFGPYFIFPTSTDQSTGNGSWQVGPAWAFSWEIDRLKFAGLFQQATSFAYTSGHSKSAASITIQPIITYQLGQGWYLKSSDANWKINFRHRSSTEIPVSVGLGKVWELK